MTKENLNKKSKNVTVCNKLLVFHVMNAGKKMEGHHHLPLSYGLLITIKWHSVSTNKELINLRLDVKHFCLSYRLVFMSKDIEISDLVYKVHA